MNPNGPRGLVFVGIAFLLGLGVLYFGADLSVSPEVDTTAPVATATPDPETDADLGDTGGAANVATPTPEVDVTQARPNPEVAVLVVNGSTTGQQAGRLSSRLLAAGFDTKQPQNADPQTQSWIYYMAGFQAEAEAVKATLSTGTQVRAMPADLNVGPNIDLGSIDVLVVIGADSLATS